MIQTGIFPNVIMEDTGLWEPWTNESIEEALADVKRKLGLIDENAHDGFIRDLLERRLVFKEGNYVWPRGIRSALVYWDVARNAV